jgi:hypothetical protein
LNNSKLKQYHVIGLGLALHLYQTDNLNIQTT